MKNTTKVTLAAGVTAFAVGMTVPTLFPNEATGSTVVTHREPEQVCVDTLVSRHWNAGDLCDTLNPASGLSERDWRGYNRANGWEWVGRSRDCWDTSSTTGQRYILCWDGTIMKMPKRR